MAKCAAPAAGCKTVDGALFVMSDGKCCREMCKTECGQKSSAPGLTIQSTSTEVATVGAKIIKTASNEGFAVGDKIMIGRGTANSEVNTIVGFGSLVLETPLSKTHPSGSTIEVVTAEEAALAIDVAEEAAAATAQAAAANAASDASAKSTATTIAVLVVLLVVAILAAVGIFVYKRNAVSIDQWLPASANQVCVRACLRACVLVCVACEICGVWNMCTADSSTLLVPRHLLGCGGCWPMSIWLLTNTP
jgi:hypothetical protein